MQKLLICTHNKGKFIEISHILNDIKVTPVSLESVGIDFEVKENGKTYQENAILKARTYGTKAGLLALADDAGLEVAALNGAPGVASKRFFKNDLKNRNRKLLDLIKDKVDKRAKFVSVVAVFNPVNNLTQTFIGEEQGLIVEPRGKARIDLGYDSIFFIPELNKTYAEISLEEKNQRSHRAIATRKAVLYIKTLI